MDASMSTLKSRIRSLGIPRSLNEMPTQVQVQVQAQAPTAPTAAAVPAVPAVPVVSAPVATQEPTHWTVVVGLFTSHWCGLLQKVLFALAAAAAATTMVYFTAPSLLTTEPPWATSNDEPTPYAYTGRERVRVLSIYKTALFAVAVFALSMGVLVFATRH